MGSCVKPRPLKTREAVLEQLAGPSLSSRQMLDEKFASSVPKTHLVGCANACLLAKLHVSSPVLVVEYSSANKALWHQMSIRKRS